MSQLTYSLEEFHSQLEVDMIRLYRQDIEYQRLILLGTTNEIVCPMVQAFFSGNERVKVEVQEKTTFNVSLSELTQQNNFLKLAPQARKLKLVILSPELGMRKLYLDTNIHASCGMRVLFDSEPHMDIEIEFYGVVAERITEEEFSYLNSLRSKGAKIKIKYAHEIDSVNLDSLLVHAADQHFALLLDVEVLKSSSFSGVSRSNPVSPLTTHHAIQLAMRLGEVQNLIFFAITGYNPCVEDIISGHSIGLMVYYFSLHYANRFIK